MDDPDLLTVAGNAATDLFTLDGGGEVSDRMELLTKDRTILGVLTFTAVRDRIADALGFHLAALRREREEALESAAGLMGTAFELRDHIKRLERELAEKDRLIKAQAERIAAQSELLSRRAETP